MNSARFRQIEALYHAAREAATDERAALLARADPQLRHEVELLLSEQDGAEFLDRPAIEHASDLLDDAAAVQLEAGARLGPFRIEHKLGEGGMGVVYKAEDTRLGRLVALKFVSDELSSHPEALSRFVREAQTASALNHPNICTIHDIGEQDGRSFIVMEYLEGTTLKDRLAAGPLRLDTVLDVGAQIADALDAAHTAGIIHRDIKPANILIGSRSRVKVLDFGLATMRATAGPQAHVSTMAGTRQGVVMGTAAYMAPEQASGQIVDHRADIWSFGVVLYEMVTGTRPAPGVPLRVEGTPELEPIISKCLESDRELRYQHASELRNDLERLRSGTGAATVQHPAPVRRRARWLSIGAAAVVVTAAVSGAIVGSPGTELEFAL